MPKASRQSSNADGLDIPKFLRITKADVPARKKRWEEFHRNNPPRPFADTKPQEKAMDPSTLRFLREMEQRDAAKKQKANGRLKQIIPKIDRKNMRWDARNNKFVPDRFTLDGRMIVSGAVTGRITSSKPNFEEVERKPKKAVDDLGAKVIAHTTDDGVFNADKLKKFAKANGVWDDKYASLNNGLQRMNVVNRLRNKTKKDAKFTIVWK